MNSHSEKSAYWCVWALASAAFIFNTTEFIPVALLSDIGRSFTMPVSSVGLMMTVYAWVVSLFSLPLMLLTARMERRKLLLILFVVFIAGHVLSVLAWNFQWLLTSRIIIALAHAVFWSITSALAMRVAPKGKQQMALAALSMGSSLATVLGLPIGRLIGQWLGWRTTLGVIGILALCVMVILFRLLPRLPSENAGSLRSLPLLAKRPILLALYAMTALVVGAHFTAYSYIEPFALQVTGLGATRTTAVLLVFGVSGLLVSWLFGRVHRHHPNVFLYSAAGALLLSLLLLQVVGTHENALFVLALLWGMGISGLSLCMAMRVLQAAPDATDVATAIYSGIYNIGIGGGALLGGMVMQQYGLTSLGYVGAALAMVGLGIFVCTQYRNKSSPT